MKKYHTIRYFTLLLALLTISSCNADTKEPEFIPDPDPDPDPITTYSKVSILGDSYSTFKDFVTPGTHYYRRTKYER